MNGLNQNYNQITKNGLIENAKTILINKFGFLPQHKRLNSENIKNSSFLLSKSSLDNSKKKTKNFSLYGNNQNQKNNNQKNNKNNNNNINNNKKIKVCQSYTSLINNISVNKFKKQSRNYIQNNSNIANDINTKYYSTFYNKKPKILKKVKLNNYNYSYSISKNYKKKQKIKILEHKKNITPEIKKINNKNIKKKNKFHEIILNVKPIIKKKENIINNQLWSKLINSIDQKQNNKIKKLKNRSLNKVNININTNININIKNNILNYQKENNDINIENQNNINYSNLTTNNVNINNISINKNNNNNSKNYLPNISLNDITNFNPPEKDYSTISLNNDKNSDSIKEKKIQLNRIILERKKEKNKNEIIDFNNKRQSKNKNMKKIITIKKENKINKLNSSSMFEDSHADNNNTILNKRQIKYCDTDTFKTSSDKKSIKENDKERNDNENKENSSNKNELSFIGENNSYQRIERQTIGEISSEKENINNINNESDFTESNNKNIFNYNNKYYNLCNIPNNSTNQSENFKIYRLLSRNYSYNVSSRGVQDEAAKLFKHENPNINYHFISEIERNNIKIINLSKKKFLKLKDNCIFKILSFGIDSYLPLIKSDIHIKNKINKSLNKIFENSISDFKFKYKDFIEVINYKFEQNKIKSYYNNNYILDLILNCRIISKDIEKSLDISCNYLSNKKKFDYLWKIDLQEKNKINKWISSEINTMKNFHKTISYTSQVSSFCYGDEIQMQINIFNINNIIEPESMEWCEPIISFAQPDIYETTKFINNISFDQLRACEVEKQILLWHDKLNKEQMNIYNEVNEIFKNFFKIKSIYFDKSRFCFYKIVMIPYKIGSVLKNKYCSFDINIIDFNNPIKNEIQCIYFMNTNFYTNKMDIRLGTILTLYIIDMQVN